MRHPTRAAIDKFNELLHLTEDRWTQDWEIECADPRRVAEFLDCYHSEAKTDDERFTMMALILGSYEQFYESEGFAASTWNRIASILESEYDLSPGSCQVLSM